MGAEGGDAVSLPATTSKSSAVNTGSQDRSPCVVKSKARHDKQKSTWLSHSHTHHCACFASPYIRCWLRSPHYLSAQLADYLRSGGETEQSETYSIQKWCANSFRNGFAKRDMICKAPFVREFQVLLF